MPSCFNCRRRVTNNRLNLFINFASFGVPNKPLNLDSSDILQLPDPVNADKVVSAPVTIGAVADAKKGQGCIWLENAAACRHILKIRSPKLTRA
jgi:hypothetical protein